jgi:hypothetical protein
LFTLFALKYCAMVVVAITGIIQAAAAYNNLRGMLFFRQRVFTYIFAVIAVGVPLGILFVGGKSMGSLNIVAGSQQAGLFFFSTIVAIIITAIVSSLVNIKLRSANAGQLKGLIALREGTVLGLLWERVTGKR